MPQSRKRHPHPHHHAAAPAKQRTKGRMVMAILFAVFGGAIAFFAANDNYFVLVIGILLGACIGYVVGKNMEASSEKGT